MKVRATKPGFYQCLREVGSVFEVSPHLFSKHWMVPVDETTAEQPEAPAVTNPGEKAEAARALLAEIESGMNFMQLKAAVKALTGQAPAKKDDAIAALKALAEPVEE